jgi:hypothetical protein
VEQTSAKLDCLASEICGINSPAHAIVSLEHDDSGFFAKNFP